MIIQEPDTPKIYGLPKIHKPDVPLRPIADCTNSVTQNIGKLLNSILQPVTEKSTAKLKNSEQFCDRVRTLNLTDDDLMGSFDVAKLFPSVTTETALEALEWALDRDNDWTTSTALTKKGSYFT